MRYQPIVIVNVANYPDTLELLKEVETAVNQRWPKDSVISGSWQFGEGTDYGGNHHMAFAFWISDTRLGRADDVLHTVNELAPIIFELLILRVSSAKKIELVPSVSIASGDSFLRNSIFANSPA